MPGTGSVKIFIIRSDAETPEYLYSDDSHRALVNTGAMGASFKADLEDALSRFTEFSSDTGTATGGSNTTLVDAGKSWQVDIWKGAIVEVHIVSTGLAYYSLISGNTATTLTFAALAGGVSVASGNDYAIRMHVGVADIFKWGGTALTGRDISLDLKTLIDDSVKGLLRSVGDITPLDPGSLTGRVWTRATAATLYAIPMATADTQYTQALPANTKKITARSRDGTSFRLAFADGKVAGPTDPYFTVPDNASYDEDGLGLSSKTLYVACALAGKTIEVIAWT